MSSPDLTAAEIEAVSRVLQTPYPIFVDIDPHTFNINPALVTQAANDLARGGDAAAKQ